MSDLQKLLKKTKNPTKKQVLKAELGEKSEGLRDALKAGKGNVVSGAKKLQYHKEGLAKAESMAPKMSKSKNNKKK